MDCGAGIYCIGSVHLEHAKTEYSSHSHYAVAPFPLQSQAIFPRGIGVKWLRACIRTILFGNTVSYRDHFGQLAEPSPRNMACTLSSSQHIL